jgi:hypothetical protein
MQHRQTWSPETIPLMHVFSLVVNLILLGRRYTRELKDKFMIYDCQIAQGVLLISKIKFLAG